MLTAISRVAAAGGLLAMSLLAQTDDVSAALRAGKLERALDQLERTREFESAGARLDLAELTLDVAEAAGGDLATRGFRCVLYRVLKNPMTGAARERRLELRYRAAVELANAIAAAAPEPGSQLYKDRVRALRDAYEATSMLGRRGSSQFVQLCLTLIPIHFAAKSYTLVNKYCDEVLEYGLTDQQRIDVRSTYGLSLLRSKQVKRAVPFLHDYFAAAPADPAHVYPAAELIPLEYADDAFRFLLPVVRRDPSAEAGELWTRCLDRVYRNLRTGPKRKSGLIFEFFAANRVDAPLPQTFGGERWGDGFRISMADQYDRGKKYSGRDGLTAVLPASAGWRSGARLPAELRRWGNEAFTMQRGSSGPVLAVYWFAPHHGYWYGTTPPQRGVTGKTVRGFSKGAVVGMVSKAAYETDARRRKVKFKKSTPLPYRLGVGASTRRQWRSQGVIYDETFFSIGQVTCEVLLRINERDLERLEPELRWLYANLRKL